MIDLAEGVLGEFAERQRIAFDRFANQPSAWLERVQSRKALDNAEQYKNRKCDPARHAARLAKKRAAYALRMARKAAAL